jgi:hypothetical protein
VFEETISVISKDTQSQAYQILHSVNPQADFKSSKFLKFLYCYLLSIRSKMWHKSGVESEGQYAVTQELMQMFRTLANTNFLH